MSDVLAGPGDQAGHQAGDQAGGSAGGAAPLPGTHGQRPPVLRGPGTWSLSLGGVRTVAVLELRQRVKSSRWIVILTIWGLVIGGLTALIRWSIFDLNSDEVSAGDQAGALMFGVIVFLVLSLGALISPALSATSVNGDRSAGVLATMQSTLLSPAELAVGKLLAAWASALALLAVSLPFVFWAYVEGGTSAGRFVVTLLLLALTLLVVCAIGLGFSALTARTSSSAVLTYLTVAFLGLGLPLLFVLALPLVTNNEQVVVRQPTSYNEQTGEGLNCVSQVEVLTVAHTDRIWWLLAASPYVVVSDAAPADAERRLDDPLTAIREAVREVRFGPEQDRDYCYDATSFERDQAQADVQREAGPVWPFGLAADLALGAGFLALTVRRLRTPANRLPRNTRVA